MENTPIEKTFTASLEILTGPARGRASWLTGAALDVLLAAPRTLRICEPGAGNRSGKLIARLLRVNDTYEIEAVEESGIWVNGIRTRARKLQQRDLVEFGDAGPLSRFQLYSEQLPFRKSFGDILGDFVDYTRVSRKPLANRIWNALTDFLTGITRQTTLLFRLSVLTAIALLIVVTWMQYQSSERLQQKVDSEALKLEAFSRALKQAQEEALKPNDFMALRQEVDRSLSAATERLSTLEQRSSAIGRVIASARQSIVFLQGAYGFRHKETGALLRHVINDEGQPLLSPLGQPMLTLEGDGVPATRQFTGTAFVITEGGVLVTNRHVALPWEDDASMDALGNQGLEPYLVRFVGFLPDKKDSFGVSLINASEQEDIALLSFDDIEQSLQPLQFGNAPNPGDEVVVMGYPTGLRTMLAQTGTSFLQELQADSNLDFWAVALKLARNDFIQPLASRGIVGRTSDSSVVYDAETTYGGSGGPVLAMNGLVVAVNTAVIPEYGGSNFGVPVSFVKKLLDGVTSQ